MLKDAKKLQVASKLHFTHVQFTLQLSFAFYPRQPVSALGAEQ